MRHIYSFLKCEKCKHKKLALRNLFSFIPNSLDLPPQNVISFKCLNALREKEEGRETFKCVCFEWCLVIQKSSILFTLAIVKDAVIEQGCYQHVLKMQH